MWLTRIRQWSRANARITACLILGGFAFVMAAPLLLLGPVDLTSGTGMLDFETLVGGIPWQMGITVVLLILVWLLDWGDITGLSRAMHPAVKRPLVATAAFPLVGIMTFTMLLTSEDSTRSPLAVLGLVIVLNFFVGLSEELLFRGFLFGALRRKNRLMTAILVSSVAFGMLHLVNAGVGQDLGQTLFQMLNATALGVLFCALVLQGTSLWPAVLLHMIWNCYAMMGVASAETLGDIPETPVDVPAFSLWSLLLPTLVLMIGLAILRGYHLRTGARLMQIVPAET